MPDGKPSGLVQFQLDGNPYGFSSSSTWGDPKTGLPHRQDLNCFTAKRLRISRLRERENLEEAARAVLKHLGELKRPYLTAVEEKLLGVIEQEYGIAD